MSRSIVCFGLCLLVLLSMTAFTVYLPFVTNTQDIRAQRLGAHWWYGIDSQYLVNRQWIRYTIQWDIIEPVQGTYNWPAWMDTAMAYFNQHNVPVLINFHRSPAWARSSQYLCALPNEPAQDDFIRFVLAVVERYSVEAIEIWNEVEMDGETSSRLYWCCGCGTVAEYNTVLNAVYDAVKIQYPELLVVGGSLISVSSVWTQTWLATDPKMDILSFHYYRTYAVGVEPSVVGLQSAIAQLKTYSAKPLWLDETALLCDPSYMTCDTTFREQQAQWLEMVYPLTGIEKIFWFTHNWAGWKECNMVNEITDITYPVFDLFAYLVVHGG